MTGKAIEQVRVLRVENTPEVKIAKVVGYCTKTIRKYCGPSGQWRHQLDGKQFGQWDLGGHWISNGQHDHVRFPDRLKPLRV